MSNEVGWLITKEHNALEGVPSRVGWGQFRVHAKETDQSFDRVIARTIFMDKSLTAHMIPEPTQVRWRSFEDDGFPAFDGLVSVDWLFNEEAGDEDLAYNIDRFNENDVGAIFVWYSVEDIYACGNRFGRKEWRQFALNHPGISPIPGSEGRWIQIYT